MYTTDNWQTQTASNAAFYCTFNSLMEEWKLEVTLPAGASAVEYAICYTVNGQQYWDNNLGQNYRIEF